MAIFIALLIIILLLTVVMLLRTLRLRKGQPAVEPIAQEEIDANAAAKRLSEAIQIQTISTVGMSDEDREPLLAMHEWIEKTYPYITSKLDREVVNGYSLLYRWPGTEGKLLPVLLNAHLDVVPVADDTRSDWTVEPFGGEIRDGRVWGRGALDMKNQLVAILDTVEGLLAEGYTPKRTIYLAFGHDEEISGFEGSKVMVEELKARGIQFAAVLDEGGLLTKGVLEGVDEPVGMLGMTEKGYVTFVVSARAAPGHSSVPPRQTAIGIVARAIALMDDNPMPARLDFILPLLTSIGHLLPFGTQFVIANAWLFKPLLLKRFSRSPQMNAMIRTTHAATIIEGGVKENILPASASAKVNSRILPGETVQDVIDHFTKVIDDPRVTITLDAHSGGWDPSGISPMSHPAYLSLELVIRQVFDNVDIAPYPMLAATDSRYYQPICKNIYKFSPILIGPDDRSGIHGIDERISIEGLGRMVAFFRRLVKVWGEAEF